MQRPFLRLSAVLGIIPLGISCGNTSPPPAQFQTCTDSPTELLRLENAAPFYSVDAFDLTDAISVHYARDRELEPGEFNGPDTFSVVDNCGGDPIRLVDSFSLPTGVAYVGGEVVLCSGISDLDEEDGMWTLLEDGSPGDRLEEGVRCYRGVPPQDEREPSFGLVQGPSGTTQHLPDGSTRKVSSGDAGYQLVPMDDGAAVFEFGAPATIHPADGSAPITVDLPEPVRSLWSAPGAPAASDWIVAFAHDVRSSNPSADPYGYAVDLRTGAWFQTPELDESLGRGDDFSIRDGLMAATTNSAVLVARAGWMRSVSLSGAANVVAVLDAQRVFVLDDEEARIFEIPLDEPTSDSVQWEVSWSRPLEPGETEGRGGGFLWNEMVLARHLDVSAEMWAYPLDGRPGFPFVPVAPRSRLHVGEHTITGLSIPPGGDENSRWLYQRRFDGEFEVIAENLLGGRGIGEASHPWTPELGRVLYAVRDGDAVSVRQHVLQP
ncbi:MAG: hypothetical protein ACE37F_21280 [Nannocystaceae bacterium]|nr:hypothetical protein [bacterium]